MVLSRIVRVVVAAASMASSSCSVVVATDSVQCSSDADCEARGSAFAGSVCAASVCVKRAAGACESDADCKALGAGHEDDVCVGRVCQAPDDPKWGCVGKVEPLPAGKTYTLTTRILDLITNQPAPGITIKLCNKYDAPCATPLPLAKNTPEDDGRVTVDLPSDVEAYLDVQGGDYYPQLIFFEHLAQPTNEVVYAVSSAAVASLAATAGVTLDPAKGILLVRTTDCQLEPTAGASVTVFPSDQETRFYTVNKTTNPNASQTDSAGDSGFINVTPGTAIVTATIGPMGKQYGKVSTLVRAGTMTAQILRPTPGQ